MKHQKSQERRAGPVTSPSLSLNPSDFLLFILSSMLVQGRDSQFFVFLIKELLFQKSETWTERIAIGVEIVGEKTIISRKLIIVFKTLERFVATDAFESFKESEVFLVAESFGTEHTKHIADVLKGKSPPILYLNNAATGFDDKSVHGNAVELPKTICALRCVANLAN